ncbi:MAG: glycoside hydrolase family 92 protein [Mariniphaga sp.]|nr:glycoside hydrolase family 92 protein [Mariniphaga sp.]
MAIRNILVFFVILVGFTSCNQTSQKDYVQYVNPLIGTSYSATADMTNITIDNYGQVIPAVSMPFGMTQWTPQVLPTEQPSVAPFYSNYNYIHGFRATHWIGGLKAQDYGSFTLMPVNELFRTAPEMRKSSYTQNVISSDPSYFSVLLESYNIMAEVTATKRAGFFRFSWLMPDNPKIIIDVNSDEALGYIKIDTLKNEVYGYNPVHRMYNGDTKPTGFSGYFVARFDEPISDFGTFKGMDYTPGKMEDSNQVNLGAYVGFVLTEKNSVLVKIGTSFTSIENARENLDVEIPDWDFTKTQSDLYSSWNNLLGKIDIEGGDKDDFMKFYTSLYRSCLQPRLFSDIDGSYPGFGGDSIIHKTDGFDYYSDFPAWTMSRAQMPLVSLVAPNQYEDMLKSLIIKAENGGWMPTSPMWNSYTSDMIGDNISTIIADAYLKGFNVDINKAWPFMLKNAYETPENPFDYINGKGRRALESYLEYGYIPLEDEVKDAYYHGGQVSRTLEYAYNDWVLAQVAKKLGKTNEFEDLLIRAENYVNVFDPDKGWVNGRFANDLFTDEFIENVELPFLTDGTPKQYTWNVPHNIPGLIETMGGTEIFTDKLNNFFDSGQYKHEFVFGHHNPYLLNYIDDWKKTQETVKNILGAKYGTTPMGGLAGNESAGQLSAWYVFSAMGFYPVCSGSNEYQLSSPIFNKVTLNLNNQFFPGNKFEIIGKGENQYNAFNKVKLNGKESGTVLNYNDLINGGKLVFSLSE